jgi:hypothetical protein
MSNLSDIIGNADMINGSNYSFVNDRFGNPNSAIYFNNGFIQLPSNVYFEGDFTITTWFNLKSFKTNTFLLSFDVSSAVSLLISNSTALSGFVSNMQKYAGINSPSSLLFNLNEWYFIGFVVQKAMAILYVNGVQVANATSPNFVPASTLRAQNFIGKSNYPGISRLLDGVIDDLKIYKGSLSAINIFNEYIRTSTGENNYIIQSIIY